MEINPPRRYERYVAIGDSSTEGLDDPDGNGGYRGWSRRLAERIAAVQGKLLYANLAVTGRSTREIRDQQLQPAASMQPDLATVFSGTNDVLGWRFDADQVAQDVEHIQRTLIECGATVLTFTLPDLRPVMPIARGISPRIDKLNEVLRWASSRTGARLLDFAAYPVASDPRLWSADRIHANSNGHARMAAALSHALGLPGTDDSWKQPLPPRTPRTVGGWLAGEITWTGRYLLPWMCRWTVNRLSDDPRQPKLPTLQPVRRRIGISDTAP